MEVGKQVELVNDGSSRVSHAPEGLVMQVPVRCLGSQRSAVQYVDSTKLRRVESSTTPLTSPAGASWSSAPSSSSSIRSNLSGASTSVRARVPSVGRAPRSPSPRHQRQRDTRPRSPSRSRSRTHSPAPSPPPRRGRQSRSSSRGRSGVRRFSRSRSTSLSPDPPVRRRLPSALSTPAAQSTSAPSITTAVSPHASPRRDMIGDDDEPENPFAFGSE